MKLYGRQLGLTLVELMIAMLLGLVILGAVLTVLLSNSNTFRSNEATARIQESARFAFELIARDLREAGGLPCGDGLDVANVLNNADTDWWADFSGGLQGYDGGDSLAASAFGTAEKSRVNGTDAILLSGMSGRQLSVDEHNPNSAQFKITEPNHGFGVGDILIVCDFEQASIFQMTGPNSGGANNVIVHNTGNKTKPGNCSKGLGVPVVCTATGTPKTYGPNSRVARFRSSAWYVGCNGRADCGLPEGRSLYRSLNGDRQEVVDLIDDLQILYLEEGESTYTVAAGVGSWGDVVSVQLTLQVGRSQQTGTDPINRVFSHTVALRNRLP